MCTFTTELVKQSLTISPGKVYMCVGDKPNGYKVWNENCEKFVTVRDVVIDEPNLSSPGLC